MNVSIMPCGEDCTQLIQNAINECFWAGGGTVTLEDGEYHLGGIRVRSNITLYLKSGVKLIATRDIGKYDIIRRDTVEPIPDKYKTDALWSKARPDRDNSYILLPGSKWTDAIIRIVDASNVKIIAEKGALIDGCNSYDPLGEERYRGVHGISAYFSENLEFEGYTIKDTGNWAHCVYFCKNMSFRNITVLAGHDGIHVAASDNIEISDCEMYTGDDAIAGFDLYRMTVRNCIVSTACSSFRIGGTDILIENCRNVVPVKYSFRGSMTPEEKQAGAPSETGRKTTLSAFTYYSDFTLNVRHAPGNIVIRNCSFEGTSRLLHYNFSGNEPWQKNRPLDSITFENVKAAGVGMSLCAYGSEEYPLTLKMTDCDISFAEEQSSFVRAFGYKLIELKNVNIKNVNGSTVRSYGCDGDIKVQDVKGTDETLAIADEEFFAKAI